MGLEDLTIADFAPHVGERFALAMPELERDLELELEAATAVAERPGARAAFSLIFRGPAEPLLAQAIYALEHDELGRLEIFVVPVARGADGARYEAIFS